MMHSMDQQSSTILFIFFQYFLFIYFQFVIIKEV